MFQSEGMKVTVDQSTYELAYNGATELLAVGRVEEALNQLQVSEVQCQQYYQEEGYTEEEINEEVAIIRYNYAVKVHN